MEAPEKIYINCHPISPIGFFALNNETIQGIDYNVEYIRKDVVDDMLKTAEDHAYFAGSEAMREQLMEKAVEWLNDNLINYWSQAYTDNDSFIEDFREAMSDNIKDESLWIY